MNRAEAHETLDALREGIPIPLTTINKALAATGDLRRWMPTTPTPKPFATEEAK